MNLSNPTYWNLDSCFGALHSVWVHLGSCRNCMKLGAKQCELVQLMQKFTPFDFLVSVRADPAARLLVFETPPFEDSVVDLHLNLVIQYLLYMFLLVLRLLVGRVP